MDPEASPHRATDTVTAQGRTIQSGFFLGQTFVDPVLEFHYGFPEGWNTWHDGDEVVGLSLGQDAIIRCRVLPGRPADVARSFFRDLEMDSDDLQQHIINGLAATTGEFRVESGGWSVRGLAAFIDYDGRTYQVAASAVAHAFDRYNGALRRSIRSFRRLTGPRGSTVVNAFRTHSLNGMASGQVTRRT